MNLKISELTCICKKRHNLDILFVLHREKYFNHKWLGHSSYGIVMSIQYFWCVLDWFLVTWYYNVQQFLSQSPTHIIIPNHSEIIGKPTLVWRHLVGCLCDKCQVAGESESPMKKAMYRKTGKSGILIVHWCVLLSLRGFCRS